MSSPVAVPVDVVGARSGGPEGDHTNRGGTTATALRYDTLGRRLVEQYHPRPFSIPGAWAGEGLCAQVGGDLWFPPDGKNGNDAKAICQECPVKTECLEWALINGERNGIWGGLSPTQRAQLKRKGNAA